jgi:hypothetical protein
MNKKQVLKFWEALDANTSTKEAISAFQNKKGYGGKRTLERLAQARQGFAEGLQSEDIATKTGWSVKYVNRVRSWWHEQVVQKKSELYEETSHKQKMLELANVLAGEINIPPFWDKDLWRDLPVEFKEGKYSLPIGEVEISQHRQIKVTYPAIGAGIAEPHLLKGLFSHLSTSGSPRFAELVGDKGKLNKLVAKIERYSQDLLAFLKLVVGEVEGYGVEVCFHDEAKPGLTKWFIITTWHYILWSAVGYGGIDDSLYKHESIQGTDLWQLRFGAYVIGVARSEETLETYKNWHKELRIRYSKHPLAKDVAGRYQRLGETVQDITQRLREFSDMQNLPGHCHLCRPRDNLDVGRPQGRTEQKRSERLK